MYYYVTHMFMSAVFTFRSLCCSFYILISSWTRYPYIPISRSGALDIGNIEHGVWDPVVKTYFNHNFFYFSIFERIWSIVIRLFDLLA